MRKFIDSIRDFNRFYVNHIGVMKNQVCDLDYSLTESRVIFEVGQNQQITVRDLTEKLNLDEGYISRLIKKLMREDIVIRTRSDLDRCNDLLTLTGSGTKVFDLINTRSDDAIKAITKNLDNEQQQRLVNLMDEIKSILNSVA